MPPGGHLTHGVFMNIKIFLLCLFSFSSLSVADTLDVSGKSEFIAVGKPGFIKINGVGSGLKGTVKVIDNLISCLATFPLSSFDTGIAIRDKHLKEEYLEVQKY